MKIFKTKYFATSLIIHSVIISYFITKNSTEKAETSMLITEVIKVIETSKSNDSKKENIPIKNIKEKENLKINKQRELNLPSKLIPNPERISKKFNFSEIKTNDLKKNSIINKSKRNITPLDKKSSYKKINNDKELSHAHYKIGSINNPHPPYPIIARKKGIEGSLILNVSVNNDGSVSNVIIKKSSGHKILDKVSKETIEKWVFVPAKRMGQTIKDDIQVPIRFVLTK